MRIRARFSQIFRLAADSGISDAVKSHRKGERHNATDMYLDRWRGNMIALRRFRVTEFFARRKLARPRTCSSPSLIFQPSIRN